MNAYVFPGQGTQFAGMGKELYENYELAKELFNKANQILGYDITSYMFSGDEDGLKQTSITQPAIFLHSVILSKLLGESFQPAMIAGHSVGEFSALVASRVINFEEGLKLVQKRASAMQNACDETASGMVAVIGMEDEIIEEVCNSLDEVVVPANYNSPGQLVISGTLIGLEKAMEALTERGAKRVIKLNVAGAFHSPVMEPARKELESAIKEIDFKQPICPVYQNVTGNAYTNPEEIKQNLVAQLTAPVKWTQTMQNMIKNGAQSFIEVGPGKVLQGLVKKVDRSIVTESAEV